MMIPIAVRSSEEFLRAVPMSCAKGPWRWGSKAKTILTVVIPAAKPGSSPGSC